VETAELDHQHGPEIVQHEAEAAEPDLDLKGVLQQVEFQLHQEPEDQAVVETEPF
jgi:hypothetical protein